MEYTRISDSITVLSDTRGLRNWRIAPDDKADGIIPFITYVGCRNLNQVNRLAYRVPYECRVHSRDAQLYKGKFKYELKIWGMSWEQMIAFSVRVDRKTIRKDLYKEE